MYNIMKLRPNSNKTPYEMWKGRFASIKHINVFGRKCFIKINDNNIGKFHSPAEEGILLGYSIWRKLFNCYNK